MKTLLRISPDSEPQGLGRAQTRKMGPTADMKRLELRLGKNTTDQTAWPMIPFVPCILLCHHHRQSSYRSLPADSLGSLSLSLSLSCREEDRFDAHSRFRDKERIYWIVCKLNIYIIRYVGFNFVEEIPQDRPLSIFFQLPQILDRFGT